MSREIAAGVLLRVAYEGTEFHGWASQKGARTVQEALLGAVRAIDDGVRGVRGASRTDAGVHAEWQLASFDTSRRLEARAWALAINQHLPDDVAVRAACDAPIGFNPRFAAHNKLYRYRLLIDPVRDPLQRKVAWRIGRGIDLALLEREARGIVGERDFAAFRSASDERENTVRHVRRVEVERSFDTRIVSIAVEGSGFMHNMVRIIVGTLVDVATGRLAEGAIARGLETRDRRVLGTTAPAQGLTLERIDLRASEEGNQVGAWWPDSAP